MNPGAAGIELDHGSVKVNGYLQSVSARHIYAVGDATGKRQHSPVAWYEGPLAAHNAIVGNEQPIDFSVFPTATFTIPAIGQVGLTENEATIAASRLGSSSFPLMLIPRPGCAMKPKASSKSSTRKTRKRSSVFISSEPAPKI